MTLQPKQRIAWLDIAKAIAIFLVVLGHTLRGGAVQRILYSFHVAAFFLLSGMTCRTDRLKERIKNDFLRIMVPYYSFSVISILIFLFLGKFAADALERTVNTSLRHNLLGMLYACPLDGRLKFNMPLWFLPCLFATKMLYYGLSKLCRGKQASVLLCSLTLAAVGVAYTRLNGTGLPFHLSVALKMLAFFSFGRALFLWLPAIEDRLAGYKAAIAGFALLALTAVVALIAPAVDYAHDIFQNIASFLVTSVAGSLGICLVSMALGRCKALEYIGRSTLAILVMHKFPVLLFQTIGPQKSLLAQYDSVGGILLAVAVALITIVMCLVAEWIIRRFFPFLLGDFSGWFRDK